MAGPSTKLVGDCSIYIYIYCVNRMNHLLILLYVTIDWSKCSLVIYISDIVL